MSVPFATPAEFDALMDFLEPISSERRGSIARMSFEALGPCPACSEPVRRCDPRRLADQGLAHIGCPRRRS